MIKNLTEQDVDAIVAVLLDTADRDQDEAVAGGRPRSAAAGIRRLRYQARALAEHGTKEALADAPGDRRELARLPEIVHTDGAA